MSSDAPNSVSVFKYNMSFYYQSTIIYFVVFALYLVIRGEFVEDSFVLVVKDPILYFLALIVAFTILVLLYYLFLNKRIEISETGMAFIHRFKERRFTKDQIIRIKFLKERGTSKPKRLKIVRIKIDNRRRPIIFRVSDYDKEDDLYNKLVELKSIVENK